VRAGASRSSAHDHGIGSDGITRPNMRARSRRGPAGIPGPIVRPVLGNLPGALPIRMMRRTSLDETPVTGLEVVYREQGPKLYRALLLYAGDRDVASDAVAEAFAQALRRGTALRSPGRWIWKTAYRVAAGELGRRRSASARVPETAYEIPEAPLLLSLAMRELSPMQRASVALHDFAGYTLREVAAITGSTASAVSVHLVRAHRKLRRHLEEDLDG
jgi:RNA polymerase sigma factor (sigma-70 family)